MLGCPCQRCTMHFVRNRHDRCRAGQRNMASAALRELLEEAEEDLPAFYRFPSARSPKLRSTNHLER